LDGPHRVCPAEPLAHLQGTGLVVGRVSPPDVFGQFLRDEVVHQHFRRNLAEPDPLGEHRLDGLRQRAEGAVGQPEGGGEAGRLDQAEQGVLRPPLGRRLVPHVQEQAVQVEEDGRLHRLLLVPPQEERAAHVAHIGHPVVGLVRAGVVGAVLLPRPELEAAELLDVLGRMQLPGT
jgi:hypothetical protein